MEKMLGLKIFYDVDPENRPDESLENSGADWRVIKYFRRNVSGRLLPPVNAGVETLTELNWCPVLQSLLRRLDGE